MQPQISQVEKVGDCLALGPRYRYHAAMTLRFLTAGESHGPGLTIIVEGLPAGLAVSPDAINTLLAERQKGFGRGGRMKIEKDAAEIRGGVRHGRTIGAPISIWIENKDYENWKEVTNDTVTLPRPGHADLAGGLKYNTHDLRSILERASARETCARVAVGALCQIFLSELGVTFERRIVSIGGQTAHDAMHDVVASAMQTGETVGGVFEISAHHVLPGLGSHVHWDLRLDGRIAQAVMSIHGVKAVEIGAGFAAGATPGSALHDPISRDETDFARSSNNAGGIEGGISNGQPIVVRGTMKPLSTVRQGLPSVDVTTGEAASGHVERSDTSVVPAASVVAEAMLAIVLAQAAREKFGGDSMEEVLRNVDGYRTQLRQY